MLILCIRHRQNISGKMSKDSTMITPVDNTAWRTLTVNINTIHNSMVICEDSTFSCNSIKASCHLIIVFAYKVEVSLSHKMAGKRNYSTWASHLTHHFWTSQKYCVSWMKLVGIAQKFIEIKLVEQNKSHSESSMGRLGTILWDLKNKNCIIEDVVIIVHVPFTEVRQPGHSLHLKPRPSENLIGQFAYLLLPSFSFYL